MTKTIIRRLAVAIPLLVAVAILTFLLSLSARVDPTAVILGDSATPQAKEALRESLGLNQPLIVQFGRWALRALSGNFGNSYITNIPVADTIAQRLPVTLVVSIGGVLLAILIGIPLGVVSAAGGDGWRARVIDALAVIIVAVPGFWLGLVLVLLFAVKLGILPAGGYNQLSDGFWPWLESLILPWLAIALPIAGTLTRQASSAVAHELGSEYVRAMKLRGIPPRVIRRYTLRNAFIPIVASLGIQVTYAVSGSLIVEQAFALPGMGSLLSDAVSRADLPVLQAGVLVVTAIVIVINVALDISYMVIDPKIRVR